MEWNGTGEETQRNREETLQNRTKWPVRLRPILIERTSRRMAQTGEEVSIDAYCIGNSRLHFH